MPSKLSKLRVLDLAEQACSRQEHNEHTEGRCQPWHSNLEILIRPGSIEQLFIEARSRTFRIKRFSEVSRSMLMLNYES